MAPLDPRTVDSMGRAQSLAPEPGDALVRNARTFPAAPGNHPDRRRAALSLDVIGDDVTFFKTSA